MIREVETNEELLNEIIVTTDNVREKLNKERMVIDVAGSAVDMKFTLKDNERPEVEMTFKWFERCSMHCVIQNKLIGLALKKF